MEIKKTGTIFVNERIRENADGSKTTVFNVRLSTAKGRVTLGGANLLAMVTASGAGTLEPRPNIDGGRSWSFPHREITGDYNEAASTVIVTSVSMAPDVPVGDAEAFLDAVKGFGIRAVATPTPAPSAPAPDADSEPRF